MKRRVLPAAALVLVFAAAAFDSVSALDFSFRPKGFLFIPAGPGNITAAGNERYGLGGGGELGFEFDFASLWPNPLGISYAAGIEGGLLFNTLKNDNNDSVQLYSGGGSLGAYWFPLSRLLVRADGVLGVYQAVMNGAKNNPGLWWRAGGELGFRITPMLTAAVNGGWRQYRDNGNDFSSGVYTGLAMHITFETGTDHQQGVDAVIAQDGAVYPALMPLYQTYETGTVTLHNRENAEIRDVRLSFRAGAYTASEFPCGTIPLIAKGRSATLPLYADFSPEILRFADSGRILGEVVIRYRLLGEERVSVRTAALAVHNRNTVMAGDPAMLAAFISPNAPEVLEFSKYITGLARTKRRPGLNQNMEFGIWLFEGMRAGVKTLQAADEGGNEVQFPAETLAYGSGNVRDIALLYGAALEAANIRSAFIALPDGEILGTFDLGLNRDDAATAALFNGPDKLMIVGDEVWLPVALSKSNEGFSAAWQEGIRRIDSLLENDEEAEMILFRNAWASYPPAPFPELGTRIARPEEGALTTAADTALQNYIQSEFAPKLAEIQEKIKTNPTGALYNQLGNLYLRSGRIAAAKAAYEQAANMGLVGAMANRGNVALNERDFAAAERWFRSALSREPENRTAQKGLEQVENRR